MATTACSKAPGGVGAVTAVSAVTPVSFFAEPATDSTNASVLRSAVDQRDGFDCVDYEMSEALLQTMTCRSTPSTMNQAFLIEHLQSSIPDPKAIEPVLIRAAFASARGQCVTVLMDRPVRQRVAPNATLDMMWRPRVHATGFGPGVGTDGHVQVEERVVIGRGVL